VRRRGERTRGPGWIDAVLALLAVAAIAVSVWRLEAATDGLVVTEAVVGTTPVTVFRPDDGVRRPAVVIAHGFAGSQQLMHPFATTLARGGYVAVTFDFLGHGRNPTPLAGDVEDVGGATRLLVAQTHDVARWARGLPWTDRRLALLGHSMASDVVIRAAQADPDVAATVAVSMFAPSLEPGSPRNLLVVVGGLEPAMLKEEGLRAVAMAADGAAREGVTYGDVAAGTARRLVFSDGVEHIGVLYGSEGLAAARDWLDAVFGIEGAAVAGGGFVDARGPWILLLLAGLVLLARPLTRLLPTSADPPAGAGLGWGWVLGIGVAGAVLTPLILWPMPTALLPVPVGGYLALHFGVYGLITLAGLVLAGMSRGRRDREAGRTIVPALALAAVLVAAYGVGALGLAIDRYAANWVPVEVRYGIMAALLAGILPWALADEWLTRRPRAPLGAYAVTKVFFLLSLVGAIALQPRELFFLAIILPVAAAFFLIYGLIGGWAAKRTGHPFAGAIPTAVAFAWANGVVFPVLAG
jgi:hypothetical protein